MTRDSLIVVGIAGLLIWFYRTQIGTAINPFSRSNIANKTAESLYTSVTGSTGTPGADIATAYNQDADATRIIPLKNYFFYAGYTPATIAKATDLGWTDNDIARAKPADTYDSTLPLPTDYY